MFWKIEKPEIDIEEKIGSKEKYQYFKKSFGWILLQECHKIFLHILLFQNFLSISYRPGGWGVDPFPLFRLVRKEYIFLHAPLFPLPLVIPLLNGPSIKKILFFPLFFNG